MKIQMPSKYPWKSSREPLGVREPQVENPCPSLKTPYFYYKKVISLTTQPTSSGRKTKVTCHLQTNPRPEWCLRYKHW